MRAGGTLYHRQQHLEALQRIGGLNEASQRIEGWNEVSYMADHPKERIR